MTPARYISEVPADVGDRPRGGATEPFGPRDQGVASAAPMASDANLYPLLPSASPDGLGALPAGLDWAEGVL